MDKDVLLWVAGLAMTVIGTLLLVLHKVYSDRIDAKADVDTVKSLDQRITLMHEENKSTVDRMESRFRQDCAMLNTNMAHLTGRVDQVLTQLSQRA